MNQVKAIFAAIVAFFKKLFPKMMPPAIGSKWVYRDADPFTKDVTVEVVDVKGDYVKYRAVGGTDEYSTVIPSFLRTFVKA